MIELPTLTEERVKKPSWLKVKLPTGENYRKVRNLVDEYKLHTICESGKKADIKRSKCPRQNLSPATQSDGFR